MKYVWRFLLLMAGFAFTTAGLMAWRDDGFRYDDLWPLVGEPALHPLHLLAVGLAMIALAIWEILLLERQPEAKSFPASSDAGYRVRGS